jgi:sporulation protein YlmC with PRC-barrel domain
MYTKTLLTRGVLFASLVVLLLGYGLTGNQRGCKAADEFNAATTAPPSGMMTAEGPTLKRASCVMHARVKSPQGETLGRIHDIVLTPDLNQVSYVALSTGGILGLGATLHAIPWSAVSTGLNDTYVVPISKQQLKQSRGFRAAYWPSSPDRGWLIQGGEPTYRGQTMAESRSVQERRFTRVRGTPVKDAEGRDVGSIRDMIIAMDNGRIDYTVVSTGGLFGLGAKYAAVPQTSIALEPQRHLARLDVDRSVVVANSFPPNRFPDLANPAYAQRLSLAFAPPAGAPALGYVPPTPAAPAQRAATPPAALTEPTEAELTGTFNPASVRTIEGTVIDEGKFRSAGTGPDMLWLRLRTDSGQIVPVNVGSRSYVAAQDFYVVRGDRIRLTGSEVPATAPDKHVFLPTEITYNHQVLRLRSPSGAPLWQRQTEGTAPAPSTEPAIPSTPAPGTTGTSREPNEPNMP